ncbi:DUF5011 domain-containing protein [Listeria innocua]|uniref:immunoglobulin-like domain-containing protein n=1 Tax=Listeria innocua TaxID=1642 RepID=UPI001628C462|nr:immunoglobulin-like domain-containing protein [Listeria innocua]MBC1339410.1 DUF5011 domain-containing protein [Listeria innocua]MBC1353650.1 DUF5011 domain-containing protein [Listeria innocua]
MSQKEKSNKLVTSKQVRPNKHKWVVGISVATMLLVGGGVGTGLYLSSEANTGNKAERQVQQAAKAKNPTNDAENGASDEEKIKEDVLGTVVGKQEGKNRQVAAILDGETETAKEKSMRAHTVALAAISHLPSPEKTKVQVVENVPVGGNTKDKEVIPVISLPTPGESLPDPEPQPTPPPVSNTAPHLTGANQTISIGTAFNPYDYVTALDEEDGDITDTIQVTYTNVDSTREGNYTVTYQVADSRGATSELSITVTVTNEAPVIFAENKRLSLQSVFNPMEAVTATDYEDGNITDRIVVMENNVDTSIEGHYIVIYRVTDAFGKETTHSIMVTVENDAPVIHASDRSLVVGNVFEPLTGVTATDEQDGDITSLVQIQSNDVDTTTVGTYHVTYSVEDSAGLRIEKTVTVTVTP